MLKVLGRRDIVKSRDNQIDNIKGSLILLVVFGHMLLASSNRDNGIVTLIYSFHMPAFIFLNGVFSKHASLRKALRFGAMYLIVQAIYILVVNVTSYPWIVKTHIVVTPIFHVWYLLSLTFWYFLAVLIKRFSLNRKIVIVVSILAALLIRYTNFDVDGNFWSYMRAIVFAPYFVLGFYVTTDDLSKLRVKTKKYKGLALFSSFFLMLFNYLYFAPRSAVWMKIFFGYVNCTQLNQNYFIFFLKEIAQSFVSGIFIILLLILIPNGKGILNYLGRNTLFIFICHPLIYFIVYNHIDRNNIGDFIAIILAIVFSLISIALSLLLESFWLRLKSFFTQKDS